MFCAGRQFRYLASYIIRNRFKTFYADPITRFPVDLDVRNLLYHMYDEQTNRGNPDAVLSRNLKPQKLETSWGKSIPNRSILELLSQLGLEVQLFAYIFRFAGPFRREIVQALESLQMSIFIDRRDHGWFWPGLCLEPVLNYFRMVQKIRDEYGLSRLNSPSGCYRSFEDIVELERSIDGDDIISLIVQCGHLKLIDEQHTSSIYRCASTFSQLASVFEALNAFKCAHSWYVDVRFACQFESLARRLRDEKPEWRALDIYLNPGTWRP